jgi:hypothetical protein
MDEVGGEVTDHGVALRVEDIPWAGRQLWSNDAAYKNGTYYLYFPLKDRTTSSHRRRHEQVTRGTVHAGA